MSKAYYNQRNLHYNRGEDIIELQVKDETGAKIEVFRWNISDTDEYGKALVKIAKKYGAKPTLPKGFFDLDNEFLKL